jgi:hypothetical protein
MARLTAEERYKYNTRKQQAKLEDYAAFEIGNAEDLLKWYQIKKKEISDEEYRMVAFFKNKEYLRKPGSLTLLYKMYLRCIRELPRSTKETVFDLLAYRFMVYSQVLKKGGFDG